MNSCFREKQYLWNSDLKCHSGCECVTLCTNIKNIYKKKQVEGWICTGHQEQSYNGCSVYLKDNSYHHCIVTCSRQLFHRLKTQDSLCLNTVVPRYLSLIHSGTLEEFWNQWVLSKQQVRERFLLPGSVVLHTNSSKCDKSQANTECWDIIFSHQNVMSKEFNEFWSPRMPRYHCISMQT